MVPPINRSIIFLYLIDFIPQLNNYQLIIRLRLILIPISYYHNIKKNNSFKSSNTKTKNPRQRMPWVTIFLYRSNIRLFTSHKILEIIYFLLFINTTVTIHAIINTIATVTNTILVRVN